MYHSLFLKSCLVPTQWSLYKIKFYFMLILKDYNETKLHSRSLLTSIHCYNYVTTVSNKPIFYIFKDEPNFYRPRRILSYVQVPWGVCVEVFLEYFALYSIGCTVYSIVLFQLDFSRIFAQKIVLYRDVFYRDLFKPCTVCIGRWCKNKFYTTYKCRQK